MAEPNAGRNLADLVAAAAAAAGDRPAVIAGDSARSWAELDRDVDAAAAAVEAAGVQPGERVGLALGNVADFPAAYFGVLRAGCVAVPLNPASAPAEFAHQLRDSGARLVVAGAAAEPAVGRAVDGWPEPPVIAVVGQPGRAGLIRRQPEPAGEPRRAGGGDDLAVLLYTSGTSGRPKGAMLSHRALLANLEQLAGIDPPVVTPDDVVLVVPPLFHVYGLNAGLGLAAHAAATVVLVDRFDPAGTLELVRRHRVTNIVGAPPMYVAWSMLPDLADAFTTVRLAVSGAAPLPPEVLTALTDNAGKPVFEGYGLTETAPVLTTTLVSGRPKPGSVGRPVPGVELKLVDEDGDQPEEGDAGEIVVRGANLFSGYWPDGSGGPDADGWFATGDVAYVDEDGDLHLVDRLRELILVSGFNVYPQEVEQVLDEHPDIVESAVVAMPHPYTGQTVKAYVVQRPRARLSADDVIAYAAERLARFKCPTAVEFVRELPHSTVGKVARARLRDDAASGR